MKSRQTNFYNNICEAALIEQSFSKSDIEHVQIAHSKRHMLLT